MANNPYNSTPIGFMEKPLSSDHNQNVSQDARTLRDLMKALVGIRTSNTSPASKAISGFIGDGFRVVPSSPAALSFQITPGQGFIHDPADVPSNIGAPDILELHDLSTYKPVVLQNPVTFPIVLPTGINSRIDIVEVRIDRRLENLTPRRQFDAVTEGFVPKSYFKTLAYDLDGRTGQVAAPASSVAGLSYKVGIEGVAPVAPPTTAGYVKIAEIRTAAGTVTVTGSLISDMRKLLVPSGMAMASIRARVQWNAGAQTVTVLSINAPPSVELGIRGATGDKGNIEAYCIGGLFTNATVFASVDNQQNLGNASTIVRQRSGSLTGPFFGPVLSGEQANLAAATPPILTGFATNRAIAEFDARFADASGNQTQGVEVEDLIWNVMFMLGYH